MSDWQIAVIVGVAVGLALGVRIARDSARRQPITGGAIGQLFHYTACVGLTGMPPFVLAALLAGLPFVTVFGTAVGFLVFSAGSLLLYAAVEPRAAHG